MESNVLDIKRKVKHGGHGARCRWVGEKQDVRYLTVGSRCQVVQVNSR